MTSASDDRWTAGAAYEAYMGRWSRPLARTCVEWLRPKAHAHWLDVGCGTGALTSTVCERCEPASVVACDPSESFVQHARESLEDRRASFIVADSNALPSRDGGFDFVVSGLVLNFLPDPSRALGSMRERLCAGGVAAAYVWDYADGMELLRHFWDEAVALDPRANELHEGRRFPLCHGSALAALFEQTGFSRVETDVLEIPTDFTHFDDLWTPFLSGTGPAPSYVMSLDPARRELLRDRLSQRLPTGSDRRIQLRARARVVRGRAHAPA